MAKKEDEAGLRGLAIASVICSLASWVAFAIVLAPMGIVFAILALKSKDNTTRTWAIVGLVTGIVVASLMLFGFLIFLSMF